jgi:hypothetical protein
LEGKYPDSDDDLIYRILLEETSDEDLQIFEDVSKICESSGMTFEQTLQGLTDEKLEAYAAATERFSVKKREYLAAPTLLQRSAKVIP